MCRVRGSEGERLRGGVLGLGLLMGAAVFSFGHNMGCKKAEILAIKDDGERPHSQPSVQKVQCCAFLIHVNLKLMLSTPLHSKVPAVLSPLK